VAETDFCFWAVAKFVTSAVTNADTDINNAIRLTRYLLFSCNSCVLRNARLYRALRAGWPANSRLGASSAKRKVKAIVSIPPIINTDHKIRGSP
jgi:hypothetical protein